MKEQNKEGIATLDSFLGEYREKFSANIFLSCGHNSITMEELSLLPPPNNEDFELHSLGLLAVDNLELFLVCPIKEEDFELMGYCGSLKLIDHHGYSSDKVQEYTIGALYSCNTKVIELLQEKGFEEICNREFERMLTNPFQGSFSYVDFVRWALDMGLKISDGSVFLKTDPSQWSVN